MEKEINKNGNEIQRSFLSKDRYIFDFDLCTTKKGYAQIDTGQDASYYGTWCNPFELKIVSYVEGDITIVIAKNKETFVKETRDMKQWQDEMGWGFKGIDPGFQKNLKAEFQKIGLDDLLH